MPALFEVRVPGGADAGEQFGRLDVLVSNAGTGTISPLADLRVEERDQMVDVNVKGVLHGIGAALPVFRAQGTGHFITTASTAAFRIVPAMAVYAGTKFAVRAICEGLRQEAGDSLRVTTVSPGPVATDFAEASTNPQVRAQVTEMRDRIAIPPEAIARAIAFAIEQPATVDVNEIVVRPTSQNRPQNNFRQPRIVLQEYDPARSPQLPLFPWKIARQTAPIGTPRW
ncbi:SDR family NAD(P)-dependent oxidoreductase [Streptomyces sp. NPDC032472]|uniref:SDR family oxidoreductase n=1 Tax=Streptomyces sp. NPDC032472 TaxID=3155018 RepID=UPI0034033F52